MNAAAAHLNLSVLCRLVLNRFIQKARQGLNSSGLFVTLLLIHGNQAIAEQEKENTSIERPIERWLHLEKAFLRRIVPLSESQEISLAAISVEGASNRVSLGKARAPIDISRDREQPKAAALLPSTVDESGSLASRITVRNLEAELIKVLTDDQADTYRKEQVARENFSRDASALGVTLFFDAKLKLTPNQIDQVRSDLMKWSGVTAINLEAYEASDSIVPIIKYPLLLKHLSRPQFDTLSGYRQLEIQSEPSITNQLFTPVLISK